MVTGESMPVTKEAGQKVIGGTLNQTGALVMSADRVGRDTMLAQIVQMVAAAQRSRAPIQRLADVVSGWFVPAVILIAVLAFVAWRSEEHTSELQSLMRISYAVFCLKKKNKPHINYVRIYLCTYYKIYF